MVLLVGCGPTRKGPEYTVYKYIDSMNNLDLEGVLECIEPGQRAMAEGLLEVVGAITGGSGKDVKDFLSAGTALYALAGEEESVIDEIDYIVTDVEEYDDEAVVYGYDDNSGKELTFYLIDVDGEWYLRDFDE